MVGALICNQSIPVRIWVVALGNTHNANLKVEMIHTLSGSAAVPLNLQTCMCGYVLYYLNDLSEGLPVRYAQRIDRLEDAKLCFSHCFWIEAMEVVLATQTN